jgi:hypothetical protein
MSNYPGCKVVRVFGAGGFDPRGDGDEEGAVREAFARISRSKVGLGPYPDKPEVWAKYRDVCYYADNEADAKAMSLKQSACALVVRGNGRQLGWRDPVFEVPYADNYNPNRKSPGDIFSQLQNFARRHGALVLLNARHAYTDEVLDAKGWPGMGDPVIIGNDIESPEWVRGGATKWTHMFAITSENDPTDGKDYRIISTVDGGGPGINAREYWLTRSLDGDLWAGMMSCYGKVDRRGVPLKGKRVYGFIQLPKLPREGESYIPEELPC